MDNYQQQPEGFEDRLRRMMLNNPNGQDATSQRPVVKMPPPQSQPNFQSPSAQVTATQHSHPRIQQPRPLQQGLNPPHQNFPPRANDHRGFAQRPTSNLPLEGVGRGRGRGNQPPYAQSGKQGQWRNTDSYGDTSNTRLVDPNTFSRRGQHGHPSSQRGSQQIYKAQGPNHMANTRQPQPYLKVQYLQSVVRREVALVEMDLAERNEKSAFSNKLGNICREVCDSDPERLPTVRLECFGSLQSGFASAGSDIDLVIVTDNSTQSSSSFSLLEEDLPRRLEKRLLQHGIGARLLTRTRVPIIKICETPDPPLLSQLREEREKWDALPYEAKYPHLAKEQDEGTNGDDNQRKDLDEDDVASPSARPAAVRLTPGVNQQGPVADDIVTPKDDEIGGAIAPSDPDATAKKDGDKRQRSAAWTRERKSGRLDFPKEGVGIQSDINFFNPLGLHNTQMLRCYSICDPRVRPMVLFVKAWAKKRKINSSYSGTLSSYGYVLMVLHYLVNVVQPPVLPNLQSEWRPSPHYAPPGVDRVELDGWTVDFWRREDEIASAAKLGHLSPNQEPVESLLIGFFNYYAAHSRFPSFYWMQQVLSLRTPGGTLSKEQKGWVKAITEEGDGKRVQHRYLFCIEDPFELSHNVARTVTHNGIVAIRDEFRRADRILNAIALGYEPRDGHLFDALDETQAENNPISTPDQVPPIQQLRASHTLNAPTQNPRQQSHHARKQLDLADKETFPTLGTQGLKEKSKGKKKGTTQEYGEISGDQAKAFLNGLARKKPDGSAADIAVGAAEAVLRD